MEKAKRTISYILINYWLAFLLGIIFLISKLTA